MNRLIVLALGAVAFLGMRLISQSQITNGISENLLITGNITNRPMVCADLVWEISTNWQPGGYSTTLLWPPEANKITYNEIGQVSSNLLAVFEWKGRMQAIQLEAISIRTEFRAYHLETNRVYLK